MGCKGELGVAVDVAIGVGVGRERPHAAAAIAMAPPQAVRKKRRRLQGAAADLPSAASACGVVSGAVSSWRLGADVASGYAHSDSFDSVRLSIRLSVWCCDFKKLFLTPQVLNRMGMTRFNIQVGMHRRMGPLPALHSCECVASLSTRGEGQLLRSSAKAGRGSAACVASLNAITNVFTASRESIWF